MSLLEFQQKYNHNSSEKNLTVAISSGANQGLNPNENSVFINYINSLLNSKQQQKILTEQTDFNLKILKTNKNLVYATWALVVVSMLLVIANIVLMFLK
ncbi:MAG: hypothetical protein U9Q85_04500 [Patescibacteria group bacterium]|nr:hypothetical protein [Patescibacteria group bacterium]